MQVIGSSWKSDPKNDTKGIITFRLKAKQPHENHWWYGPQRNPLSSSSSGDKAQKPAIGECVTLDHQQPTNAETSQPRGTHQCKPTARTELHAIRSSSCLIDLHGNQTRKMIMSFIIQARLQQIPKRWGSSMTSSHRTSTSSSHSSTQNDRAT